MYNLTKQQIIILTIMKELKILSYSKYQLQTILKNQYYTEVQRTYLNKIRKTFYSEIQRELQENQPKPKRFQ